MATNKETKKDLTGLPSQENKSRVTAVTITVTTYGTEAQRNLTVKKMYEELQIKGFDVKIGSIRTLSTK